MKIGVCGAQGSGKSTLCMLLGAYYKRKGLSVALVQEVVRNCPFEIHDKSTVETAKWIFFSQAKAELEACRRNEVVICDRTVYDPFVYANYFDLPKDFEFMELEKAATDALGGYDNIILVRPDVPIVGDGVRSENVNFQDDMDKLFYDHFLFFKHREVKTSQIFSLGEEWKSYCL